MEGKESDEDTEVDETETDPITHDAQQEGAPMMTEEGEVPRQEVDSDDETEVDSDPEPGEVEREVDSPEPDDELEAGDDMGEAGDEMEEAGEMGEEGEVLEDGDELEDGLEDGSSDLDGMQDAEAALLREWDRGGKIGERPLNKAYHCMHCDKSYTKPHALKIHMRNHTGVKPYKCTKCPMAFTVNDILQRHMLTHYKPFVCNICNKNYAQAQSLKFHMMTHTGERPFTCQDCGKGFIQKGALDDHAMRKHKRGAGVLKQKKRLKKWQCEMCPKAFESNYSLQKHVQTHLGDKLKPHNCIVCGKAFRTTEQVFKHLKTHTGVAPFKCFFCGTEFPTMDELVDHTSTHTGEMAEGKDNLLNMMIKEEPGESHYPKRNVVQKDYSEFKLEQPDEDTLMKTSMCKHGLQAPGFNPSAPSESICKKPGCVPVMSVVKRFGGNSKYKSVYMPKKSNGGSSSDEDSEDGGDGLPSWDTILNMPESEEESEDENIDEDEEGELPSWEAILGITSDEDSDDGDGKDDGGDDDDDDDDDDDSDDDDDDDEEELEADDFEEEAQRENNMGSEEQGTKENGVAPVRKDNTMATELLGILEKVATNENVLSAGEFEDYMKELQPPVANGVANGVAAQAMTTQGMSRV